MRHAWSVICLYTSRGIESNNASLLECIDQIVYKVKPGTPDNESVAVRMRFYLVTSWRREDLGIEETGKARIRVQSPSGNTTTTTFYDVDLDNIEETLTAAVTFENVKVVQNGIYEFIVDYQSETSSEWRQVAVVPLVFRREFLVVKEN